MEMMKVPLSVGLDTLLASLRKQYPELESLNLSNDSAADFAYKQAECDAYNAMPVSDSVKQNPNWMSVNCPICKNKGYIKRVKWVDDYKRWEVFAARCACWNRRQVEKIGVLPAFSFETFIATEEWQQKMVDAAHAWCMDPKGTLYIGGQIGSGKTHIAMACAQDLIDRGKQIKIMTWSSDSQWLKRAGDQYLPYVGSYRSIPILYIDDLFRSRTGSSRDSISEADRNIAYDILDYRCAREMPTIITSEFSLSELCSIDPAIGGRVAKSCIKPEYVIGIGKDPGRDWRTQ